jgi:hypothetical protein
MFRVSHILTTAAIMAVAAGPASAATFESLHSTDGNEAATTADSGYRTTYQPVPPSSQGGQDLRSPDAVDAAQHRGIYATEAETSPAGGQDLRSPDAVDAAAHRGIYATETTRGPYALNRDYGSPDAADAARDLPPVQVPVVAAQPNPSGGFDWGDAGIGAAGMIGLFSIAGACALMLGGRRRKHGLA